MTDRRPATLPVGPPPRRTPGREVGARATVNELVWAALEATSTPSGRIRGGPMSESQTPASRPGIGRFTLFPGRIPDEPPSGSPYETRQPGRSPGRGLGLTLTAFAHLTLITSMGS